MKSRFEGPNGRRLLIDSLLSQKLVEHNEHLARKLTKFGKLSEFAVGQILIHQGSLDNDVFFLIDGEVSITVNGRHVATRGPTDSVGEMVLVDGAARRSATVAATRPVCALKLSEAAFRDVANDYPLIWRAVARVVADRLRQRNQFHRPPNDTPTLFVGSSVEGLAVAKHIQLGLKHAPLVVKLWTNGIFGPGGVSLDSLIAQVEMSDFALFVFGPDDKVASRSMEFLAPRDNVVFELGLFMGRLNRNRCFLVREQSSEVKIPSDLLGITPLTYVHGSSGDIGLSVATVCIELEEIVQRLGVK